MSAVSLRGLVVAVLLGCVSAACGPNVQSEACKKMIDCANAIRAGSGDAAYGPTYGVDGRCWLTDGASEACTDTCKSLTESMAKRADAPAVCK
jgi:hypothetical protein